MLKSMVRGVLTLLGPSQTASLPSFSKLIGKVAAQGSRQSILEHFKDFFAGAAGTTF